ncbi:RibD family protein [Leptolyngbya ohadii]|uniref:RibD family protein n=1 Tax=Leptolyngbya ohadii TaxID=1962290 RepID=UPI000B5A08B0|nr:RibD family protein [Leptolyngbya ohadii]
MPDIPNFPHRPYTTAVLAMSADGKIADRDRSPARFGSAQDKAHLEARLSEVDAALFGAGTLRAYGTSLPIKNPALLEQRQRQGKPPQPIHIVCSASGQLDPQIPFFRQPIPRWLLTTETGAKNWAENWAENWAADRQESNGFDRLLTFPNPTQSSSSVIDWTPELQKLINLGLHKLLIMGGGELMASLLAADAIDELWLTVCPLILGGTNAPTPIEGIGFPAHLAPRLELLSVEAIGQEVFLHYRIQRRAILN